MIAGSLLTNLNCFISIKMKSDAKRTNMGSLLKQLGYPFTGARPLEWPPAIALASLATDFDAGYPSFPSIHPDFLPSASGIGQKGYPTCVPIEGNQYPRLR